MARPLSLVSHSHLTTKYTSLFKPFPVTESGDTTNQARNGQDKERVVGWDTLGDIYDDGGDIV